MKREIKFRAWDKDTEHMLQRFNMFDWDGSYFIPECEVYSEDDLEIMQYTGLKDNNNVENFEGDIVKD